MQNHIDADVTQEIRDNLLNPKTVKAAVLKYVTEAVKLTESQIEDSGFKLDFSGYDKIIMVSKSIGSVVDMVYAGKHGITAEHILFTPLEQAFQFADNTSGIAFSGEADPVAHTGTIVQMCAEQDIQFYSVTEGNHSLETGVVDTDIRNLSWIMSNVDAYVTGLDKNVYDFSVEKRGGGTEELSSYRGKVLLIVNTATGCGFTPQYQALEDIYEKYQDEGFEILDFPCNQFMNQAPGTSEEIYSFCTSRYAISFPQYAKIHVNGEKQIPLYGYLKSRKGFQGFDLTTQDGRFLDRKLSEMDPDYKNNSDIKWNFTKFLVDKKGRVISRYEPTTDISVIETDVASALHV